MRYIVFDVETPNRANNRMSAIGITIIENGIIADSFFSLVDPEVYFDRFNTQLTGISADTVQGAPNFAELWEQIKSVMESGILVAHNAVFDMSVLKKCLHDYGIEWKNTAKYICTVQAGKKLLPGMSHSLNVMCDHYGISLDHHKADSDSRACAEILLRYMESGADVNSFIRTYHLI
ncbi:3'-5' exonuclease [Ruminococcus sp. XPD3002]|uniref:3'-5' exonuclease n=1 Tax=Ruminococcus sp. XPD3002 TaxID=1452269 RepID=UPI00091316F9|nr:DNA polymerase-3 subunit epsilon [Ruminococcus flavefaciens]